ncbi:MAG: methylmalonyl-CoA mutase [Proteobacteria bacterium]|nr:methylmalonyl-CoA mutase [Pseudomonadota bacterium]
MDNTIPYTPKHKIRFVTATALFDGHDASINIMRRLLQQGGAEVIHLGHNRSVQEIVNAVVQEDAQAVAVSSYQGGHVEFFKYMRQSLNAAGRPDVRIFGGGGGVIIPSEIDDLHSSGVTRIYSPEDGRKMGLLGMIADMLERSDYALGTWPAELKDTPLQANETLRFARALTLLENKSDGLPSALRRQAEAGLLKSSMETDGPAHKGTHPLVLGVTGTGGAGKSSLTDEIIRRFTIEFPERRICVFSVDPSKKKTGGALLGDRIRMNAINSPNVFMRSFATRGSKSELATVMKDAIALARSGGFDLLIVETSGIGQGDTGILGVSDLALYVMTSEYGAATQLEKIDMLDFADLIAINKFDRRGSEDAFRDVKAQLRRSRFNGQHMDEDAYPLFGTIASKFNDDGVNALYRSLLEVLNERCGQRMWTARVALATANRSTQVAPIIPQNRTNYLSEIAATVRDYHNATATAAEQVRLVQALGRVAGISALSESQKKELANRKNSMLPEFKKVLDEWDETCANYRGDKYKYEVRGKTLEVPTFVKSLSGSKIARVSLPQTQDWGEIIQFVRCENVPGSFPYTSGVFPFKRADEDPKRQFAGEGGPARTNRRFHYLTKNDSAKRLSTAFDSVTLYGDDPAQRPDIYGKVGESGVSIATLEDMKTLYSGFDLCDPNTSVSMTINGPAPILLAFFLNAAVDQQVDSTEKSKGRMLTPDEFAQVRAETLRKVRGTVQADILKEDQAQNTCIFSTDFALKMMGDIQDYFIRNDVRNYYSVSISGYHIAEAGANPITQLAFTLANGFTYVEYYLSRGMKIDDFAPNLSFFFSNGMDPEYSVIGRVARRIWAIAIRDKYNGNERSQKLKYHIQTSGRSLHAQEIDFNDIRTTLQALLAINDNCNSLHTNAYDEAITTPTEESVRRSMAIQMIINREFGLAKNENPNQGSYFLTQLTDLVEESVLQEFDRISARGGVLGAMETQYQRGKIQEESLYYETLKHTGELPVIGVNTFLNPRQDEQAANMNIELARASYEEKDARLAAIRQWQEANSAETAKALSDMQKVALANGNVFEELLKTARVATLGQMTQALYAVGGQYRRAL